MASVGPGCTPEAPYANRLRNWSRKRTRGNHDSSDRMCDTLILGYTTRWNFVPNALFWSDRSPPMTNSRSLTETCSSRNTPSVLLSLVELSENCVAPALFVTPPGVRFTEPAPFRSKVDATH